ncbi:MAG TPA: chloride channel protein, partial [Spongiibacteraceae bacterium]|nr:chloride channel protein [Spongiibacteraceae bacterium]
PADNHLGLWVVVVPVLGGLIVGVMARWGSRAIRGHGIPEAMEQVLLNESRIPARITWLKPVSSAIAIGTGGPFGAEGPIIATGGALGSLVGQLLRVTADERKTLLAAGAAAGMAAVFAAPVSSVLLAIELLLFERRARSLIPVALAAVTATGMRFTLENTTAVFAMSDIAVPGFAALAACVMLGALMGLAGVLITKLIYAIEDAFEKLPVHWMWWPALGGLVVGLVGYYMPQTLGVGYDNIANIVNGRFGWGVLVTLCLLKLLSWSVALGSGTSGGTLAPLFTIGGALGGIIGLTLAAWLPWLHLDPRLAALIGMAALFAGASRAFLASVVFAFETTQQVHGLLPLLGACAAAYMVSGLLMRNTIMTEKITRRGVRVPSDYSADYLDRIAVGDVCSRDVVALDATQSLSDVRRWMDAGRAAAQHQGFPVLDTNRRIVGVVTRRNLLDRYVSGDTCVGDLISRAPLAILETHSAREAADYMVAADIGRLIVVADDESARMVGIVTRGDLLSAHAQRLRESHHVSRHLSSRPKREIF